MVGHCCHLRYPEYHDGITTGRDRDKEALPAASRRITTDTHRDAMFTALDAKSITTGEIVIRKIVKAPSKVSRPQKGGSLCNRDPFLGVNLGNDFCIRSASLEFDQWPITRGLSFGRGVGFVPRHGQACAMVSRLRHLVFFEFDVPSVSWASGLAFPYLDIDGEQFALGIVAVRFTHGLSSCFEAWQNCPASPWGQPKPAPSRKRSKP